MTDLDLAEATDVAARALWDATNVPFSNQRAWDDLKPETQHLVRESALVAVAAAAPVIERAVREQIAREIDDFEPSDPFMRHSADWKDALDWAADIARSATPTTHPTTGPGVNVSRPGPDAPPTATKAGERGDTSPAETLPAPGPDLTGGGDR